MTFNENVSTERMQKVDHYIVSSELLLGLWQQRSVICSICKIQEQSSIVVAEEPSDVISV